MNIIRTIGFYQPFGTLILHGKKETRWVREGRNPPFPKGQYLIYTTKKSCDRKTLQLWVGDKLLYKIHEAIEGDSTSKLDGYAIAIGDLVSIDVLKPDDENTFVKFIGKKICTDFIIKVQWGLTFKNVQRINPFKFDFGKQGVGILPNSEHYKIDLI